MRSRAPRLTVTVLQQAPQGRAAYAQHLGSTGPVALKVAYDQPRNVALSIGKRALDIQVAVERRGSKGCGLDDVLLGEHLFRHRAFRHTRPY